MYRTKKKRGLSRPRRKKICEPKLKVAKVESKNELLFETKSFTIFNLWKLFRFLLLCYYFDDFVALIDSDWILCIYIEIKKGKFSCFKNGKIVLKSFTIVEEL